MQLNNHLQAIRGTERLRWGKPIKSGPDNSPSWSITAFRQSPNCLVYSYLTCLHSRRQRVRSRHWGQSGRGQGGSRSSSPEASPCSQLQRLVPEGSFSSDVFVHRYFLLVSAGVGSRSLTSGVE